MNTDKKIKVLYLDDEQNNLNGFKATFRFEYTVIVARNTLEAKESLAQENDIAVVIADQRMPEKTGTQFFEEIRVLYPKPMRILITGYTDIESVINSVNLGNIFRYIKKPWTDNDIRLAIEESYRFYKNYNRDANSVFLEENGYIVWDLPNHMRSLFVDILKGFEDYARLKGYDITFSADNSIQNKIAFKFTILDQNADKKNNVRKDVLEYIDRVKNGSTFEDMPIILSREEHILVSTTLRNRLTFLSFNLELTQNGIDLYKNIIKEIPKNISTQTPSFTINNGNNNSKRVTANNSSDFLVGEDVFYENNSIYISNSFNKKKEQLSKIEEIIGLLRAENNLSEQIKQTLITNFDKIHEEMTDEEQPNKKKIHKWLSNVNEIIETIVFSHETTEAIKWLYSAFNLII